MEDKKEDKKYCPFLLAKYPNTIALCKKEECAWWNGSPNLSACGIHAVSWLSYIMEYRNF